MENMNLFGDNRGQSEVNGLTAGYLKLLEVNGIERDTFEDYVSKRNEEFSKLWDDKLDLASADKFEQESYEGLKELTGSKLSRSTFEQLQRLLNTQLLKMRLL